MTTAARLAPTRMNLIRARRQLERVGKGATLLRRKREALVAELFRLARPAADIRGRISQEMASAFPTLVRALSARGHDGLRPLGWPVRTLEVEIRTGQVWGIPSSEVVERPPVRRTVGARGLAPGGAGPAATEAAVRFEVLADLLLEAAPRELLIRRLSEAVARTSRQVHMLEQRVGPRLEGQITRVRRALDEREREDHVRLKHVQRKDVGSRSQSRRSSAGGRHAALSVNDAF